MKKGIKMIFSGYTAAYGHIRRTPRPIRRGLTVIRTSMAHTLVIKFVLRVKTI
jgi:hypothetical protein